MSEASKGQERRRSPRIRVGFPVIVNWGRKKFRWVARELSEYGILLSASKQGLEGEDLKLELPLTGEAPLNLEGVVAYTTQSGVGVRFKNISAENQRSLRNYTRQRGIGIKRKS